MISPFSDFGRKVNPIHIRGEIKHPRIFRTSYGPAMMLHLFVPVRENVSNKFDSTKLSIIKAFINLCEGEIFSFELLRQFNTYLVCEQKIFASKYLLRYVNQNKK